MSTTKKLLFSVTKSDCRWDYYRCPGPGGQHVNKVSSGVRCTHIKSGAVGQACDHRIQFKNKQLAFERMAKTKEFKQWHKMEVSRRTGQETLIQMEVDRQMKKIRVDVKDERGRWIDEKILKQDSLYESTR